MAKEKILCKNCARLIRYEAKALKGSHEVTCQVCGSVTPLEAKAVARFVPATPRKLRFIADEIRGKRMKEALTFLRFSPKRAARAFSKVLLSARANAETTYQMNPENLVISEVFVDGGPVQKRFMPRAMGRAATVRKRSSHITVKVREVFNGTVPKKTREAKLENTQEKIAPQKQQKREAKQPKPRKQRSAAAKNSTLKNKEK